MSRPENVISEPLTKTLGAISPQTGAASSSDIAPVPARCAALFKGVFGSVTLAPVLTTIPLALCLNLFPTLALNASWDGSWAAVLNYARASHLQFGTDIVFPYGPLGYLMSPYFLPSGFWAGLLFTAVINLVVTAGVCLVAWRLSWWWRLLTIGVFVLIAANIEYGLPDFLLNVGLLSFGLLCLISQRAGLVLHASGLVLLATAGALAKFSAMIAAGLTVLVVATEFLRRGQRKAAIAIALSWASAFLLGWMILGQDLSHLPTYLNNGFALSNGYEAMGLEPPASVWSCTLALALVAVLLMAMAHTSDSPTAAPAQRASRLLRSLWLLAFLFMTWKHGLVRADKHHVVYFVGFVAVLAPLLQLIPSSREKTRVARNSLTITACAVALIALQFSFEPQYVDVFKPVVHLGRNLKALISPGAYFETMIAELKAQQTAARLPGIREIIGTRKVDVFGNNQAFAVLNGLTLQPRPVFQSYAAYNESLMRLNERYYLSNDAPEFVLFRLEAIDERFPPLEDARALRLLLSRYSFVASEGRFILLRRRPLVVPSEQAGSAKPGGPKTILLKEGVVAAGVRLDVSCFTQTNLWLELIPEPTLMGRLRQFCYRQAPLKLRVWKSFEHNPLELRAPASMLSAGFIASPLLLETRDVADASAGREPVRPIAYTLALAEGRPSWWKKDIHYRISRIEWE